MSDRANVLVEGSRSFYRASSAGKCVRALAGMRMGMDPLPPSEDMQRRFKDGHLHEDSILEAVENHLLQGVVRRQEEWMVELSSRVSVVGHVDGITADTLQPVEAKSASEKSYQEFVKSPERWFKTRDYYATQWSLTLEAYGKATGWYAVKDKNSGKVTVLELGPMEPLAEIKVRLLRADHLGRKGELPECDRFDGFFCPLRYMHEESERERTEAEVDEDLEGLMRAYDEAREREKQAEAVKKELGARLEEAMGDRGRVQAGSFETVKVPWSRMYWDQDKLRAALGDISPYQNVKHGEYVRVKRLREE